MPEQSSTGSAEEAKRGAETLRARSNWAWVEAEVWTERMLSALENGVTGGKWYSLIDKVHAPATLALAWTKVEANKGAAGVDGQSVERFAAKAEDYLSELSAALREDTYRPQAVKRVEIPKGDGKLRPGSATAATASVRSAGARMRCARSIGCSRKATPMWWMPTFSHTSIRSRTRV
jgi:RNA-directed DNA polymerase